MLTNLFGTLRIPPFVNHKGKDVNSDWFADQSDERSVLGHAQLYKGSIKGDDPDIDAEQTTKRFDGRLALLACVTFSSGLERRLGSSGENPKDFH